MALIKIRLRNHNYTTERLCLYMGAWLGQDFGLDAWIEFSVYIINA